MTAQDGDLIVIPGLSPRRGSHSAAQGRAERRSRVAPPWVRRRLRTLALKGRNKPWLHLTNDTCELNRFVSPFQGYQGESIPYPGRRSAAVAATLCPWLISGCPFGAEA